MKKQIFTSLNNILLAIGIFLYANSSKAQIITINSPTVCSGSSTTLIASSSIPGGTYSWNPGGGIDSSITITPTSSITYMVTYTLNGSSSTAVSNVTVNPMPIVSVNSTTINCGSPPVTLMAIPSIQGGTYLWSPTGITTSSITISPTSSTTYTVAYALNSCVSTGSGTITVNSSLSPPVIFQNGSVLTSTSGSAYQWYYNGALVSGATLQTYTITQNGSYYVAVTNSFGCSSQSASINITSTNISTINSESNSINVYPNPSKGQFYFPNLENKNQIEVYDVTGRLIIQISAKDPTNIIDISTKDNGVYFYKIIGNNISSGKLVKQ